MHPKRLLKVREFFSIYRSYFKLKAETLIEFRTRRFLKVKIIE